MGKLQCGLTKASVQEGDNVKELTQKTEIEDACHQENHQKYSQTNDTPLMQGQLATEIGFIGTSPACRAIL